jgi:uncharacterized membrane protein
MAKYKDDNIFKEAFLLIVMLGSAIVIAVLCAHFSGWFCLLFIPWLYMLALIFEFLG